jgi:hypothetical protein
MPCRHVSVELANSSAPQDMASVPSGWGRTMGQSGGRDSVGGSRRGFGMERRNRLQFLQRV